jgi:hypothetical protein
MGALSVNQRTPYPGAVWLLQRVRQNRIYSERQLRNQFQTQPASTAKARQEDRANSAQRVAVAKQPETARELQPSERKDSELLVQNHFSVERVRLWVPVDFQ